MFYIPRELFLTKGVGKHKEKLAAFEEALRDAKIEKYNIVRVSSIFPPGCKLISLSKGLEKLKPGQIIPVVLSHNETNENHRLIGASIGIAIPADQSDFGYLSEHHSFGQNDEQAGEYAEDLAMFMLATKLGLDFNQQGDWDEIKKEWKLLGKVYKTANVTQTAIGSGGIWTVVIAAAIFVI
jgi:arginine decarboxylase